MSEFELVDAGLPRKASCCKGDAGYSSSIARLSDRIDLFVDGVLLPEAISWDVDKGWVDRFYRGTLGELKTDQRGRHLVERVTGLVEVRWIKKAAAK